MAREDPLYRLRMPLELKKLLAGIATKNHRSLNAEILARLEHTLENGQACIQGVADSARVYGQSADIGGDAQAIYCSIDRLTIDQRRALQGFLELMLAPER